MSGYTDEAFALPISGHYDCGYGYGSGNSRTEPIRQSSAQPPAFRARNYSQSAIDRPRHLPAARPRSPPMVLPNSFTTSRRGSGRQDSAGQILPSDLPGARPPPPSIPPRSSAGSVPTTPREVDSQQQPFQLELRHYDSDSDLSTLSIRSRQASTQSAETTSSVSSFSAAIEPDPLPSHSHPQWLSPSQSAAFAGPRPIQPMRLNRRDVCDCYTGERVFQLSDETRLKLSRQAIYQIYEPVSKAIVGTLGFSTEASSDEVAVILRGQDVLLKRESATSNRWCFKPSDATKKSPIWYWSKDRLRGDITLCDAKKGGMVVARIQKDMLSFERSGLSQEKANEICIAAMALAELARRSTLYEDAPNLAAAIAVVALGEQLEGKSNGVEDVCVVKPRRKLTLTLR